MEFFAEADSTYGARLIRVLKEKNKDREGLVFIKNMKYDPPASSGSPTTCTLPTTT